MYQRSLPNITIGCVSIVVTFFLFITGVILDTVFKQKNEQKGKWDILVAYN